MKKYSLGILLVAVISLLGAILFTNSFEPIDNLMSPPGISGEYEDIQKAFEKAVGQDYILKYPAKGDYRSSYTFIDLTDDGDDEVIVFYGLDSEIDLVRMNVLDEIDGEWLCVGDVDSAHSEIHQIDFDDLNGDGKTEVIVGWAAYQNDNSKKLNIYEILLDGKSLIGINKVFEDDYSEYYVCDIDNNGSNDILSLKHRANGPVTEYVASFLHFGYLGVYEEGFIPLDVNISSVTSSISEKYGDYCRIYIDGYKIDSGMATDCFYWDKTSGSFVRPTVDGQSLAALTSRSTNVVSCDIDADKKIEVPVEEILPASSVVTPDKAVRSEQTIVRWAYVKNSKLVTKEFQIVNQACGYSFKFEKDLLRKVTVINHTIEDVLSFYELKSENNQFTYGKPLFSIKVVDMVHEEDAVLTYYKYLGKSRGKYYYCRIYDTGEKMGIDRKYVQDRIVYL